MTELIKVKDLISSYGKEDILKEISFNVDKGEVLFLMGDNGSGKTTLLNCLLNNIDIKSGSIELMGKNIDKISREVLARNIAYIPQNFSASCGFKVKDYLVLGRNPYIRLGNPQKSDYEIVEKCATQTKICDILDKEFNSLSGGQKQWVAITRAIVQETPIMIMDEPMSALDFGKQGELLILLHELNTQGKTIILTTHNPNHCFCIPNAKVCLIHKGVIEAYGTAESVFTENIINKIFGKYVRKSEDGSLKFSLS